MKQMEPQKPRETSWSAAVFSAAFLCPQRLSIVLLLVFTHAHFLFGAEEIIQQVQPGDMLAAQGNVNFRPGVQPEVAAAAPQPLGFGDSLRTLQLARATVRFIDWSTLRMKELTLLELQTPTQKVTAAALKLRQGQVYVSSRGPVPAAIPIDTPHVQALPKGTEFLVAVDLQAARTEITMFDGEAQLQGPADPQPVRVRTGEQGITVAGQPTQVRPILQAQNIVQWR
jgi:FecR protein